MSVPRNGSNNNNGNNTNSNEGSSSSWMWNVGVGAGVAGLVGGLLYLATKSGNAEEQAQEERNPRSINTPTVYHQRAGSSNQSSCAEDNGAFRSVSRYLSGVVGRVTMADEIGIPRASIPERPVLNNLNALLDDIYVRFVALKKEDFELYYNVFLDIFAQLQEKMKDIDPYYKKYSSRKQFAGSHFDNLRIKKPDEFDMDIVIGLPLNFQADPDNSNASDIVLQNQSPGFVQMKMGTQFVNLPMRDNDEWQINKTAYKWKDDRDFLLRKNFISWFKSVIQRALNKFEGVNNKFRVYVRGVPYIVQRIDSETSPAVTFIIENTAKDFKLDVDFVPALKFPEKRWPICRGYRQIPTGCNAEDFMVVPKPNKAASDIDKDRSWRLAFHCQEKKLMYNLNNLKPTLRLIKKLRDAQDMKAIASYYIKTLFFHEVVARNDPSFWNQGRGTLFKIMVQKLHEAVTVGKIPYFWNPENNLIGGVSKNILVGYASKLKKVLDVLEQPQSYKTVAKYLLTSSEFATYNAKFLHIS